MQPIWPQLRVLMRGTASEVLGILSDTWCRNIVKDSRTVTSEMVLHILHILQSRKITVKALRLKTVPLKYEREIF
jgi:hypothetical protein